MHQRLEREGLVANERGRIVVRDPEALWRMTAGRM
jgi:hypothetical protein